MGLGRLLPLQAVHSLTALAQGDHVALCTDFWLSPGKARIPRESSRGCTQAPPGGWPWKRLCLNFRDGKKGE